MKASNGPQHNNVRGYGLEMEKVKVLLSRERCLLHLRITCMDIKKNNLRIGTLGWILGRVRKTVLASQED